MNIVIEGPDGSGKSTLVQHIAGHSGFLLQPGEGPPKYPGEIIERCRRYNTLQGHIFDRHPAVSEIIYGRHREKPDTIPTDLILQFYAQGNLIIYCEPPAKPVGAHEIKDYDTPEHLALIENNEAQILEDYRLWGQAHANLKYTIGDGFEFVLAAIQEFQQHAIQSH